MPRQPRFVLMTNHVHLLLTPTRGNSISKTIQVLGRYYVQYFNYTYRRTGTLWEGRYKASLVDSENYALLCYRYIELNPLRASMVEHPAEYPWSSYRYNALGVPDVMVRPHAVYLSLGRNTAERSEAYRQLFTGYLGDATLAQIREMTNKCWVLGSDHFKKKIESQINRQIQPLPRGGDRRSTNFNRV